MTELKHYYVRIDILCSSFSLFFPDRSTPPTLEEIGDAVKQTQGFSDFSEEELEDGAADRMFICKEYGDLYFNEQLYSDVNPFQAVKVISAKTVEIQEMSAKRVKPDTLLGEGGFVGVYANDAEWEITPNPEGRILRVRLHKDGWWRNADGRRYLPSDVPIKVYDRNF